MLFRKRSLDFLIFILDILEKKSNGLINNRYDYIAIFFYK